MFFEGQKINHVRDMIMATNDEARKRALGWFMRTQCNVVTRLVLHTDSILPLQRADFVNLFRAVAGRPVTVRLLDPPLHEFLPRSGSRQAHAMAERLGVPLAAVESRNVVGFSANSSQLCFTKTGLAELIESNPMLGHRGCRLGVTMPAVTEMQARALIEAACIVATEPDSPMPRLEIMIPLVSHTTELVNQTTLIHKVPKKQKQVEKCEFRFILPVQIAAQVFDEKKTVVQYKVGTMIETPRGAIIAGEWRGF